MYKRQALQLARLRLLRQMFEESTASLRQQKRRQRVISFDDMLYNVDAALNAADTPWLAASLRDRYPVALIGEFQDTDPLQFAIFDRIYGATSELPAGPLFFVGDPKQAIYSFRNADLHTYLAARRRAGVPYTLRHNQRSTAALIEACNTLFAANAKAFILPGLDYEAVTLGDKPRPQLRDGSESGACPLPTASTCCARRPGSRYCAPPPLKSHAFSARRRPAGSPSATGRWHLATSPFW